MDVVHVRAVQIQFAQIRASFFREFLHRADTLAMLAIVTFPNGKRRAPITFARKRPVNIVFQPVAEASVLDVIGNPVDGLVQFHESVTLASWCGCTTTRAHNTTAESCNASRTDRCGYIFRSGIINPRASEIFDDLRVGILDEDSTPGGDLRDECAIRLNRQQDRQVMLLARLHIFLTEGGGSVNQDLCHLRW